nr:hypothetical protein [Eubacterium sp.]
MEKLDLKQFITLSEEIADKLTLAKVGGLGESNNLKALLKSELKSFAFKLCGVDGIIDEDENDVIKEYLGDIDKMSIPAADEDYFTKAPECLKYAVLSDAGKKLENDPYHSQCAMVFYDTFKLFGQTIVAASKREVNDVTMLKFTIFTGAMEKFIKELAVWYGGDAKYYRPEEPVIKTEETEEERQAHLEEALSKLNELTGLSAVKNQVNTLINLIRVQKMREEKGLKSA